MRLFILNLILSLLIPCIVFAQTSGGAQDTNNAQGLAKVDLEDAVGIPKIFWQSVEYGVGAGVLVGLASISDFQKNFRLHMDDQNLFRGMSYGLYGGIILGLYLAYGVPKEQPAPADSEQPSTTPVPVDVPQSRLEKRGLHVDPFLTVTGGGGVQLRWTL